MKILTSIIVSGIFYYICSYHDINSMHLRVAWSYIVLKEDNDGR